MIYLIILILIIIILYFYLISHKNEQFTNKYSSIKDISFNLYNTDHKLVKNKDYEFPEQEILFKYIRENDIVLQLGGNIGTSCILVDKLISEKQNNICVEPNKKIINTLIENKLINNCNFEIIEGIISNKCKQKLKLAGDNSEASYVSDEGGEDINNIPLKDLNKNFSVLFCDCEGCLCSFLDEYPYILKDLRLIIYEADYPNMCNYNNINAIIEKNGFVKKESGFLNVYIKE